VRKKTAILEQDEKKLLTDRGVGPSGNTAIASQNKRLCLTKSGLAGDPPRNLFARYDRSLAAAGYALLGMHRQRRQVHQAVERARHL